ncbi:MAG: DUF192 domain-containing protein [Candidatus Margulisiibacteriota bacterium]
MRKFFVSIFLILFAIASFSYSDDHNKEYVYADIGNETYLLEVANTIKLRFKGLSDRPGLEKNRGMVFILGWLGEPEFTMRDMQFPLDFIWLKGDQVVDLTEKVPSPELMGNPKNVAPSEEVDIVIELYSGEIDNSGIKVGDFVHFYELQ